MVDISERDLVLILKHYLSETPLQRDMMYCFQLRLTCSYAELRCRVVSQSFNEILLLSNIVLLDSQHILVALIPLDGCS